MKLKQLPNDFIVDELSNISISQDKNNHSIFILEKTGITTFDAINIISKKINIPFFEIGYAGLKDKHAITRQYISIPTQSSIKFENTERIKLFFIGYYDKKIKLGNHEYNKFLITIRDIKNKEFKEITERAKNIRQYGLPNYFDSQRFGNVIENEFIAKYIIKKNYEKAVKIYLTKYQSSEPKYIKNDKKRISENWNKFQNISIKNWAFKRVIKKYLITKNWLLAYKEIPANLRKIYIHTYQSYIWNECIKEVLKLCVNKDNLYTINYKIGSLLFYTNLTEEEIRIIPPFFKTVHPNGIYTNFEKKIIDIVLAKQDIKLSDLDIKSLTGNTFKNITRNILLIPNDLKLSEPTKDTINSYDNINRYSIEISFSLPKGSYATMITKKLFNH